MTKHEFQRSLDVKYLDAKKLKISMIGNMAVGKSCLSLRFVQNKFMDSHKATITGWYLIERNKCKTAEFTSAVLSVQ